MKADSKRSTLVLTFFLLIALTITSGCQVVSPGVTNNIGSIQALIAATPEEVTGAAKSVVEEMKLILVSAESTGLDGKVVARTAQDKNVKIVITRQDNNVSHISIRVGSLGDTAASMLILDRVKERLM